INSLLLRGVFSGNARLVGMCRELYNHREWLWTFVDVQGIEPTNNAAERALRPGRVERWRGGLGGAYQFSALSSAGASLATPCSVSTSRSANRTGGFPASGFRTRIRHWVCHTFAHGKLRVSFESRINPSS